jgi:hypothetical protein
LELTRRESEMGTHVGGSPESVRTVDRRLEGQRRHRPDPWNAHEARAQLIVLHCPQQHGMKRGQLLHQGLTSREEGFHAQRQMWAFGDQFAHPCAIERASLRSVLLCDIARDRGFGMPRLDAAHGKASILQAEIQPLRQRPCLETDPFERAVQRQVLRDRQN